MHPVHMHIHYCCECLAFVCSTGPEKGQQTGLWVYFDLTCPFRTFRYLRPVWREFPFQCFVVNISISVTVYISYFVMLSTNSQLGNLNHSRLLYLVIYVVFIFFCQSNFCDQALAMNDDSLYQKRIVVWCLLFNISLPFELYFKQIWLVLEILCSQSVVRITRKYCWKYPL